MEALAGRPGRLTVHRPRAWRAESAGKPAGVEAEMAFPLKGMAVAVPYVRYGPGGRAPLRVRLEPEARHSGWET